MAKLTAMPQLAVIDGFRGKIDFYVYHPTCDPENRGPGIPVARKWPVYSGGPRAAAVQAQYPTFSYAAKLWQHLSPEVQEYWNKTASGTNLSGRDLQIKAYISGYLPHNP